MTDEEFLKREYVECETGWKDILQPVFAYVDEYNKASKEKIEFLQIKEKFGTLRIYTNFTTEALDKLIEKAEEESYEVCEYCGSRKDVGTITSGWYKTICKDCLMKLNSPKLRWTSGKGEKFILENHELKHVDSYS